MTMQPRALDMEAVERRLVQEFGYPPTGAGLVAARLVNLTGTVGDAFTTWWVHGAMPPIEVEGFTPDRLGSEHGMNPIAALLTLDWLARDPGRAKASLARGHDTVSRSQSPGASR